MTTTTQTLTLPAYTAVIDLPLGVDESTPVTGCGCVGLTIKDMEPIGECWLTPGDPSPVGRCPECGGLVYLIDGLEG
jgi:hypothetical protein